MGKLRFLVALWVAKTSGHLLRLLGRNATQLPGRIAVALCPTFLVHIGKPQRIIAVTGTNGKTTTTNIIVDTLGNLGLHITSNSTGSNLNHGVASALLRDATLLGKAKHEHGVFEVDELSCGKVLGPLGAQTTVVTNLFRDSIYRNAHPGYIAALLDAALPSDTTLVLNADDAIVSELGKAASRRVFFSVAQLPGEPVTATSLVVDANACPMCDALLVFDFRRYHHIGRVHCPACGYHSPDPDYLATDTVGARLSVETAHAVTHYPLVDSAMTNIYNQVAAIAGMREFGVSEADLVRAFHNVHISASRLEAFEVAGKRIITRAAKGLNPVAVSRVFADVAAAPGQKALIAYLDDVFDAASSIENVSWLYDTDFELLADDSLTQIVIGGKRHLDYALRLQLAGVPKERIASVAAPEATADLVELQAVDTIYVLHDVYTQATAHKIVARLKGRLS